MNVKYAKGAHCGKGKQFADKMWQDGKAIGCDSVEVMWLYFFP